ncbi:hypothetical protein chiPu_0027893 [Chiloscyllium punctatum]|uniref:Uncharacterized protein n=1 Tax=Chiloscyllium punctatum TaxID=137246 RepID=A0A401TMB4_CHIPU|nr:hypothetical protein [Chiloscyllium punctatum]
MGDPCQPGVKAHPLHLVRTGQEEIDNAVGHHAVWKALQDVVVAHAGVQAVALLSSLLHADLVTESGGKPRFLSHRSSNLQQNTRAGR